MNLTRHRVVRFRCISIKIICSANGNACWSNRKNFWAIGKRYWAIGKKVLSNRKKLLNNQKRLSEQSEKGTEQSEKLRANGNDCQSNRKKALNNRKMALSNQKRLSMQSGTTGQANMDDCRVVSVYAGSRLHLTTTGHTGREFWWIVFQLWWHLFAFSLFRYPMAERRREAAVRRCTGKKSFGFAWLLMWCWMLRVFFLGR